MNVLRYTSDDPEPLARLFTESVHAVAGYSPEQLAAWAPVPPDLHSWRRVLGTHMTWVAVDGSVIVGFITLEPSGHLDHLYVLSGFQRQAVASALYREAEQEAVGLGLHRIFADASIAARPFFEHIGFKVIGPQAVTCKGVLFGNWRMEKSVSGREG
jgi:GNAT superfamily N-acetyltransferase